MKRLLWTLALIAMPAAAGPVEHGGAVFERRCAPCHGAGPGNDGSPMLPGTAALAARYKGTVPPQLERRRDLDAAALTLFVRHGIGAMPMFRKTELSDADIADIADWIRAGAPSRRRP